MDTSAGFSHALIKCHRDIEPRFDWMRILSSGPMKILFPSRWDERHALFFDLAQPREGESSLRKPPESVRIGPRHCREFVSPPIFKTSSPGRKIRDGTC